jgi:hypothetical protein
MGQEEESALRTKDFRDYQVNERVVAMAKKDAVVMHCLPAHRGQEITHEVLEGPQYRLRSSRKSASCAEGDHGLALELQRSRNDPWIATNRLLKKIRNASRTSHDRFS